MDIIQVITKELNVEKWQVEAAVKLIDEGCTIPFISRYRKEATGSLNDEQLRSLYERLLYLRNLEDKKTQVLGSIEEQGKLTPELKKQIQEAQTLVVVEDLYRPIQTEATHSCNYCKRKRSGAAGKYSDAADDRENAGRGSRSFCIRRKRCCRRKDSSGWSKRYYCGTYFR